MFTKCERRWNEKGEIQKILKAASVREECENSLRRLKREVIDLYQIHWPEPDEDVEEGWGAAREIAERGQGSMDRRVKLQRSATCSGRKPSRPSRRCSRRTRCSCAGWKTEILPLLQGQ